ncbi:hypothetical protein WN51_04855 [Melipona quadrifasciata]|uniref:EB domain-containing protein n=1 Tax=Melipona quadrifasciata TaxID=166423 RepID=A0A0M8ZSA8_9HYME|nr:hypothetical protein WN51_04855 [Melipona quadrifasciata]
MDSPNHIAANLNRNPPIPCVDVKTCIEVLNSSRGLFCQNGYCLCENDGQIRNCSSNNITHITRNTDIGGSCTRHEECFHVHGAVCTNNDVCDCPGETVISENRKRCLKVARDILDECVENVQCAQTFEKAVCVNQTCQCEDRYHFEPEMKRCFNNRGLDETCGNSFDCYQDENENVTSKALKCEENVCVCAENYERKYNKCVNGGEKEI